MNQYAAGMVSPIWTQSLCPLRSLCLCGEYLLAIAHHKDTENTEVAQRKLKLGHSLEISVIHFPRPLPATNRLSRSRLNSPKGRIR